MTEFALSHLFLSKLTLGNGAVFSLRRIHQEAGSSLLLRYSYYPHQQAYLNNTSQPNHEQNHEQNPELSWYLSKTKEYRSHLGRGEVGCGRIARYNVHDVITSNELRAPNTLAHALYICNLWFHERGGGLLEQPRGFFPLKATSMKGFESNLVAHSSHPVDHLVVVRGLLLTVERAHCLLEWDYKIGWLVGALAASVFVLTLLLITVAVCRCRNQVRPEKCNLGNPRLAGSSFSKDPSRYTDPPTKIDFQFREVPGRAATPEILSGQHQHIYERVDRYLAPTTCKKAVSLKSRPLKLGLFLDGALNSRGVEPRIAYNGLTSPQTEGRAV
uniref:(California timema) hypothetical protein n=1 Tax=Timema californicum TaxID=61474 RepID=A0A7R9P471_TIMCA|nr:unnamed protein product [Timema californicum]